MGWSVAATCGSPLPALGPPTFNSSAGYPGTGGIALVTSCTTGQAAGLFKSLQELPMGARSAVELVPVTTQPRSQCVVAWKRDNVTFLPAIWVIPNENDVPPKRSAPPRIQQHLKNDWPALLDDRIPDDKQDDRTPDEEKPPGQGSRPDTKRFTLNGNRTQMQRVKTYRRPTRRNEKEQKFHGTSAATRAIFGFLSRNKERLTELEDLLDIFIDSMPKDIQIKMPKRNGRKAIDLKARHIYDNWESIDWEKFVDEWVKNWIEDKAVGTAIKYSDKGAKLRGETNTIGSRGSWLHNAIGGMKVPR